MSNSRVSRSKLVSVFIPILIFLFISTILVGAMRSDAVKAETSGGSVTFTKTDTLVDDVLGDGNANPGDTLRYDLTINNTSGGDLTNVVLTDVIDPNLTWSGAWQSTALAFSDAFTTPADNPVVITLTGSDPDGDTLAFAILTPPSDGSLGAITPQTATTANVTYTPNMGHPGSDSFTFQVMDDDGNTDSATINITVINSDIAITKVVSDPMPFEGNRITYTVRAGNQGSIPLTNIVISDVLPASLTYFGHTTSMGSYNSGSGSWSIPNIGVGITHTLSIYLDINAGTAGQTITNMAEFVSMDQADANPTNNSQSVGFTVQPLVDIVMVKDVDDNTPLEGDTIVYTVYAGNSGPNDATGVQITDVLPPGVTYVSSDPPSYMPPVWNIGNLNAFVTETLRITATVNSMTAGNTYTNTATVTAVNETDSDPNNDSDQATITVITIPPGANDDRYTTIGNTLLAVGVTPPAPVYTATGTVLDNDSDPEGNGLTIDSYDTSSVQGGTVSMTLATGAFTYLPPVGFEGDDTFTYTMTDSVLTDTATVTVSVGTAMVWYIQNNDTSGGDDGRSTTPFNTLAQFMAIQGSSAEANDFIYIHRGNGSPTGLTTGITLLDSQKLIGQGVDLILGMQVIVPATSNPVMTNNGGNAITLASGNTVRGLTINSPAGAGITGGSVGGLTISETTVTNAAGPSVNLASGTLTATLDTLSSNSSVGQGINLDNVNGSFTVSGNTAVSNSTSDGIRVLNSAGLTADFGNTTITNSGSDGIDLSNSAGANFTFDSLSITTNGLGGRGLVANNAGTLTIVGATNTISVSNGTAVNLTNTTIGASGITFESISSSGADTGITLNNTGTGDFTVTGTGVTDGSGGTLQNLNDHGIELINAQDISISNMNLINATTTQDVPTHRFPTTISLTCATEETAGGTNTGCNAPIHLENTTNINLNNLDIDGSVQHGVNGNTVNGLSISNTDITNIGNEQLENGMHFINLIGTVNFNTLSIVGSETRNTRIGNNTGTANITVINSTFRDTALPNGEDGFNVVTNGSANVTLNVNNSSFIHNYGPQLKTVALGSSMMNATIIDNTFDGDPVGVGNSGVDLSAWDTANLIFNISGTTLGDQVFEATSSHPINIYATGGGTAIGRINRNDVNGTDQGAGIRVVAEVTDFNGFNPSIVVEIDNNDIDQVEGVGLAGIHIEARESAGLTGVANIDATVTNNSVRTTQNAHIPPPPTASGADAAIQVLLTDLNNGNNRVCLNATNNATEANGGLFGETDFFFGNDPNGGANTGIAQMQGFATSIDNTWFTVNGNTTTTSPLPLATGFGPISNATCSTVPLAKAAMMEAKSTTTSKRDTATPTSINGGPALIQSLGTIPAGKSMTISFEATVNDPFPDMVSAVANQGQITADGALNMLSDDPDTPAPDDPTITPVIIIPSFEFTKQDVLLVDADGNNVASPGDTIQYTVNFINTGDNAIDNIVFTDTVDVNSTLDILSVSIDIGPASINQKLASPQGNSPDFTVIIIDPLPVGEAITLTFNVDVNDPFPTGISQISNQAFVTADNIPSTPSDDPSTPAPFDPTITPVDTTQLVYLPIVFNNYANLPDLIVRSLTAANNNITIEIENIGNVASTESFWVDAYINPNPAPTAVNQTWDLLGSEGMTWGVTQDIQPGEIVTLTVNGTYYEPSRSNFSGTIAAGTPVYAQVDSANTLTTYGAVQETHEALGTPYNNIASTSASRPVTVPLNRGVVQKSVPALWAIRP